jgi:hypothetical protein
MSEQKSIGWQNIRRELDKSSKPALIALLKDITASVATRVTETV